ncbi:MAG: MinD/ParA family protein, partial [Arthrobacter sp.]
MPDPVDNNSANAAAEAEQPELRRRRDRRRGEESDARTGTMPITPPAPFENPGGRPLRRSSWAEAAEAADERIAATGAVPVIRQAPAAPEPPAAPPASANP